MRGAGYIRSPVYGIILNAMKVADLKKMLDEVPGECDVTVDLAQSGHLCCSGTVGVKAAGLGFDWEHGQFIMYPERPVDLVARKVQEMWNSERRTRNVEAGTFRSGDDGA